MSTEDYIYVRNIIQTRKYTSVHSCKKCPYITKSMFFIRNHIERHRSVNSLKLFDCAQSAPEVFICNECNFKTYNTLTFNSHLKGHSFQVSGRNSQNQIRFSDKIKSGIEDDHKDDDKIVWPCPKPHRIYVDEMNIKRFHCKDCSYKTKYKKVLDKHIIYKHTAAEDIKWFYCNNCTYKTNYKDSLIRHITIKHRASESIKWLFCEKCSFKTKFKSSLKRHMVQMHSAVNSEWVCSICSFKTNYKGNFKKHMKLKHAAAEDIKWFGCDKCTYKTKDKSYLNSHVIYKHTPLEDIKWFQCDQCRYKNKLEYNLTKHMKLKHATPEDIKWFDCDKCTYKTKYKSALTRHVISKHTVRRDKVVSM